jgi:TP901 family phage tail tape measure protein
MADLITRIIINARDNASATLGSIQENAGKLATALAAYFTFDTFKDLVNSAAKFEKELDAVAAKGGYTSEEMKKLSEFATTVGVEFGRSGTEAAQGLTILAGAGLSASEAMKALPSVLAVSASESVSMEVAASGLVATVGIMGLKFSDTARVADVLTKAANLSDASVVGLNESFKGVGSQAAAAGYSVEQTAAMLDVLAKYALKGEVAGTGLGATLTALNDPTSKARVELSKLGINTSDVGTAMDGMKKAGVSSASAVLAFGETAKATVLALMKEGSPALKKFEEDLVSAGGASKETAAKMTANFEGAKGRMLAVFENLKTTLGTPILEPLTNGFNKFSTFVTGHVPLLVTMFETLATVMGIKAVQAVINMTASLSGSAVAFGASQLAAARAALSTDIFATSTTRAATAVGLLSRAIPVFLAFEVGKTVGDWLTKFEGFRIGTLNITQGVIGMGIAIKSVFNGDVLTAEGRAKYAAEIAFLAKSFDEQRAAASNATIEEQKNNATKIEGIKGVEAEKNAATAKEVERLATARQQAEQFSAIKIEALKNESAAIDARYKLANEAIAQNLKLDIEANHSIVQSAEQREKSETDLIIAASDKVMGVLTEAANNKKVLAKAVYDDAIAKSEGDTQKRAEYEKDYANAKKEIDIDVLNTYRSTVDQMTAAAQSHRDKAIGYAKEILDAEDRKANGILQLERIGMSDKELFASKKKEIETGISDYKKALAEGDFKEAQRISKENEGLILSLASTEKTQSSEVSSLKRKYIDVIGQTEAATKGLQSAEESQANALETNAKTQIEKMAGLKDEIDKIDSAISKDHLLKMNVDGSQITTIQQKIDELKVDTVSKHTVNLEANEAKIFKQTITADTFSKHTVYSDVAQTQDQLNEIKKAIETHHNVISNTAAVAGEITELKKDTESKHEVKPENKAVSEAIAENKKDTSSLHTIGSDASKPFDDIAQIKTPTDSLHTLNADNSAPSAAISYNQQPTFSQHTIYVTTVQTNQNGGEIQHFADGGMPTFTRMSGQLGGFGGGDTVPAMLEPGEYIVKKEAVQKYGSGFMSKLNAMQVPQNELPKYQNGGSVGTAVGVQHFADGGEAQAGGSFGVGVSGGGINLKINVDSTAVDNARAKLDALPKDHLTDLQVKVKAEYEGVISQNTERMQLAGDKVGLENQAFADIESKLKGNSEALKIARENHATRLQNILDADVKGAKDTADKIAKSVTDAAAKITADSNAATAKSNADLKSLNEKQVSQLDAAVTQKLQLDGDKVGLENQAWAKEEAGLSGNAAALSIARTNHNTRLQNIYSADIADAKSKLDKRVADAKAASDKRVADDKAAFDKYESEAKASKEKQVSQLDAVVTKRLQLAGDKVGLENYSWAKEEAGLAGNAAALKIARENHNTRLKNIEDADAADAKSKLDKRVADAKAASDKIEADTKAANDKLISDARAAKETYKNQLDAATNEKLQLAGDKVGLENAAWAKEEQALAGNAAALSIARENHNTRLKNIANADAADAKAKLDKQTSDAKVAQDKIAADAKSASEKQASDAKAAQDKQIADKNAAESQRDSLLDELDQMNGNTLGVENRRFKKQQAGLDGSAQPIAQQIHAKKVAAIQAEKAKETASNNNTNSSEIVTNQTPQTQSNNSNTVTIKFQSPTGREASGSFARADVASVVDILKEAAARGLPPSLN